MTSERAIGVDVGGTTTKAAVVDVRGTILHRTQVPTDPTAGTKGIISVVEQLLESHPADVGAVGVGAAGFVDAASGAVTFSPNLVYGDPRISEALRTRVGVPVTVDNDANAAVWGERCFGSAMGSDHVAMLTLGTGIGSGFVVDGRLLHGVGGAAAEFGHVVVDPHGPSCPCGLRGCLEQFASGGAIARAARAALDRDADSTILAFSGTRDAITGEHVARAAREMDETARRIMREAGVALGIGLANIVNVFDPEVIVLGGSVIAAGEPFLGPARDTLSAMLDAQRRRPQRLDVGRLGNDAGMIGAAALALGARVGTRG
ncbi:MAG: ROK family protein [Actinobacteria bacterium]|nr:ROK family protein [Actinomycetota bacterium]